MELCPGTAVRLLPCEVSSRTPNPSLGGFPVYGGGKGYPEDIGEEANVAQPSRNPRAVRPQRLRVAQSGAAYFPDARPPPRRYAEFILIPKPSGSQTVTEKRDRFRSVRYISTEGQSQSVSEKIQSASIRGQYSSEVPARPPRIENGLNHGRVWTRTSKYISWGSERPPGRAWVAVFLRIISVPRAPGITWPRDTRHFCPPGSQED